MITQILAVKLLLFVVEGGVAYINNAVIKELKGNNISTTATIIAGSGNAQAGLNGLDSGIYNSWRIWAGNANPSAAPFRVNSDGKLWATNAVVSGAITATSGTLNNVTINSNCNILGTLTANQIEGDIIKPHFINVTSDIAHTISTKGSWSYKNIGVITFSAVPWTRTLITPSNMRFYNSGVFMGAAAQLRVVVNGVATVLGHYWNGTEYLSFPTSINIPANAAVSITLQIGNFINTSSGLGNATSYYYGQGALFLVSKA